MLPPFTHEGILPPGIHAATWHEIEERFGGGQRRTGLLAGLYRVLSDLRAAGCRRVYLNGSFVTAKENPGDYDLCWEEDGTDRDVIPAMLLSCDPNWIKRVYGGDIMPVEHRPGLSGLTAVGFLQLRKSGFGFKGIIQMDLEVLP